MKINQIEYQTKTRGRSKWDDENEQKEKLYKQSIVKLMIIIQINLVEDIEL